MDLLKAFQSLGLPDWFIIVASTIVILRYSGLLRWLTNTLSDVREHSQDLEREKAHYQILQHSWERDKLASILEEDNSFIREQVWDLLKEVKEWQRRSERIQAQHRDTTGILTGLLYELKEEIKGEHKETDN